MYRIAKGYSFEIISDIGSGINQGGELEELTNESIGIDVGIRIVSRVEDVQQMISPMMILVVAAFMLAMFGLGNPLATYITVTSFIPFFTPMLMFLRVGMLDVPFWEVSTSIVILIASIVVLAVYGARIYKGGVFMYGSSKSLKNIKRALQLTKKE